MIITRLKLANWRNFPHADVALRERAFIIGPNASGKSNLLDAIRFLRDVAKREGGGLQAAVSRRGGFGRVRCLSARGDSPAAIEAHLDETHLGEAHLSKCAGVPAKWEYRLEFNVETSGKRRVMVKRETVKRDGKLVLDRPDYDDASDAERLTETALEQVGANGRFREVADFLDSVSYFHLIPQLVRRGAEIGGNRLEDDPFGQGFIESVAAADADTREFRLAKIQKAAACIVPHLQEIGFERDKNTGQPHLKARFDNRRGQDAWMLEGELSDGALRLIGLLWALMDNDGLLLLEEPEISLDSDSLRRLPSLIYRLSKPKRRRGGDSAIWRRQVLLTTHSVDMLCDLGIGGDEVLCVAVSEEGSRISSMYEDSRMRKILNDGVMPGVIAPFRDQRRPMPFDLNLPE